MSRQSDTEELIKATVPVAQLWARRKAQNVHAGDTTSVSFEVVERTAYESFMAGVTYIKILEI